jgi:hypothetical protein
VITAVDRRHQALELDCHGRRITLDAGFLHGETARGEPTLLTATRSPATSRRA